jgi:hypothetical protein
LAQTACSVYEIGDGDHSVLDAEQGEHMAVYYRYHEDGCVEKYASSFAEWLERLPKFLKGK